MTGFHGSLKRTINGGDTWSYVGGPSRTIAADPDDSSYMYYGFQHWISSTSVGNVYSSSNGGATWGEVSLNETWPGAAFVRDLEANREPLGEYVYRPVYAATSSGLIKSVVNGSDWSWEKVSGLPTDNIKALAIDLSTVPGVIYVGTDDAGVFVSDDGGSIWTPLNEGLGDLNITKLAVSKAEPKMLYAGTAYGGVWSRVIAILDTDGDGVPDELDNCPAIFNIGQLDDDNDLVGNLCDNCSVLSNADQRDSNSDGYGNVCDADLNNDDLVTVTDFLILRGVLNSPDQDADLNGDGLVTVTDFLILRSQLNRPPGPSGLTP